jgi:APA family basic amino acid/polyamine antiporter
LSASIWFFAFTGYSRLATFGEEVNNPEKIIPKAILSGLGITLFLYVSTSYATLGIVSPSVIENSSTPLKVAFELSRFSEFSYLIVIASTIATGSVLLALLPGISRVLVAMSRDRKIPDYFKTIHPKQNSAYISDIFSGLLVAVGVLIFDILPAVKLSAIFILIYYSITNLCVIRLEKSERIFPVMISFYGLVFCGMLGIFLVIYF